MVLNETVISIERAVEMFPAVDGQKPHPVTVSRWIQRGVRGVKLEGAIIGRRVVTSAEAVERFLDALNSGAVPA